MGKMRAALSRKGFLQFTGLAGLAGMMPHHIYRSVESVSAWPVMSLRQFPQQMQAILRLVPRLEVDQQGLLTLQSNQNSGGVHIPLAQTQWNLEHRNRWDRLDQDATWGIVLHWYADDAGFDRTVEGYLRGFDAPRQVADYTTRTSAHFLVGDGIPQPGAGSDHEAVTILQTQMPDADGTPFTASHLQPLDYTAHQEKRQYFVRALYELGYQQPTIHSILQDWFEGSHVDANTRTLAIEITGRDFDSPGHSPGNQQKANTVGVIWALMRRYGIRASNILGHHEIQLDKPDPGKRYMAQIRCLLCAKAMTENDILMKELVFGKHLNSDQDPIQAARIYLQWVRDYLVLVSRPSQVYAWEAESGYWFLNDELNGVFMPTTSYYTLPLPDAALQPMATFASPGNHEGVDLYLQNESLPEQVDVLLISDGECLYSGKSDGFHPGKQAIFLHRQPDGSKILSIYGNLSSLSDLQAGAIYPPGYLLGTIGNHQIKAKLLHFAIAYRTTWERYLATNPDAARSANPSWVRENYLDPMKYLDHQMSLDNPAFTKSIANLPH